MMDDDYMPDFARPSIRPSVEITDEEIRICTERGYLYWRPRFSSVADEENFRMFVQSIHNKSTKEILDYYDQ